MIINENILTDLENLSSSFSGDIFLDEVTRIQYATDASVYRELPLAVVLPRSEYDICQLVELAKNHNASLIPRAAGTSLAGQVVGKGIVVDVSKYMTQILEINPEERWVRVEPGVIPDELNQILKPYKLYFSPETSTSNRCMIGGMVGNNSCGAHSLVNGSTRDHLISVRAVLSNTNVVEFRPVSADEFNAKCEAENLEGSLYRNINELLAEERNQKEIREQFPHPDIKRRNTGYALDLLLKSQPFDPNGENFNFSKLLAGSEGTLAFFTEFKISLDPLPPPVKALVCVHCESLEDALQANLIALKFSPQAIELMDDTVMNLSKDNLEQQKNRFFIKGNPAAMLMVEFAADTAREIEDVAQQMESELRKVKLGYHFPIIWGTNMASVWSLRKAGLGLLSGMPGDAKPVAVVEDTAVRPEDLPDYISDFKKLLKKYNLSCAFNAHIGTGELHLRPILNLKIESDIERFRTLARETAQLVKKYRGSLSGEHGDGRLRGEFLPQMIGQQNFELLRSIKRVWDPENIFNQGKIFDTPAMNTFLRYSPDEPIPEIETIFDFSKDQGIIRSVEKCNGSGDCRRPVSLGGMMCPSYQATLDENKTTRSRANMLREFLSRKDQKYPFDQVELFQVLDLCLSCKACKSECPSNVDMARLKAEFLQHYNDQNGMRFRTRLIANNHKLNQWASRVSGLANFFLSNKITSTWFKKISGFTPRRSIPLLANTTLKTWMKNADSKGKAENAVKGQLIFFVDEFTNYNDTLIGIKAYQLLVNLGYEVRQINHDISGRAMISKGFLRRARVIAENNVKIFAPVINPDLPLVGIEPSSILTFRDEYPELLRGALKEQAVKLAGSVFLIDEFIANEIDKGNILPEQFSKKSKHIKLHGHCFQKALASTKPTLKMLSIPENYTVEEIPSGCCGMAGSFGYEKEHYDLSMKIGEMVLFPEVRKTPEDVYIAAPGTSCRHQIKDGTQRKALHPVEILLEALN